MFSRLRAFAGGAEGQDTPVVVETACLARASTEAAPGFPAVHPLAGFHEMSLAKDRLRVFYQIGCGGQPLIGASQCATADAFAEQIRIALVKLVFVHALGLLW